MCCSSVNKNDGSCVAAPCVAGSCVAARFKSSAGKRRKIFSIRPFNWKDLLHLLASPKGTDLIACQKSPIFSWKSPIFSKKSPVLSLLYHVAFACVPTAWYKRDRFTGNVWYKLRMLSQPSNTRTNIPKHASGPISWLIPKCKQYKLRPHQILQIPRSRLYQSEKRKKT